MGKGFRFYAGLASGTLTHIAMASLFLLAANQMSRPAFSRAGNDLPPGIKTACTDGSINKLISCADTGEEISGMSQAWANAFTQKFGHPPLDHINDTLMTEVAGVESQLNTLKDRKDSVYTSIAQLNMRDQHTEAYAHIHEVLTLLKIAYAGDKDLMNQINEVSFQKIKIKASMPNEKDKTEEKTTIPPALFKSNQFQVFVVLTNAQFRGMNLASTYESFGTLPAGQKAAATYGSHVLPEVAKAILNNIESCRPLAEIIPTQHKKMKANPLVFAGGELTPRETLAHIRKVMVSYAPFANSWGEQLGRQPYGFIGQAIRKFKSASATPPPSCSPKG